MKKYMIAAAVLAVFGVTGVNASAQQTKPLGLSVRAGIFWPSNDDARDAGSTWFGGGIEYKLGDLTFANQPDGFSGEYSLSADYYSRESFRNIPVMLNFIGRNREFYYIAGAGIGFTREPTASGDENKTAFSYQAGIGYEFQGGQTPLFIEGKYIGSGRSDLNGFGVFVGARL